MGSSSVSPRIGVIGVGAIGGFYGLMLARAGFDVHFLARSEFSAIQEQGLRLESAVHGSLQLQPVQVYQDAASMPACDWVLVAAKTTSNVALAPVINQLAADGAKVVLLQNGLGMEDELRSLLAESVHLLGGLCYICVHRGAPGVVMHQSLGAVSLGYHSGPALADSSRQALLEDGAALFRQAGIDSTALLSLLQARWQKLVWNVPYNGLSVLLNAGTRALMSNASSRELIHRLMLEVILGAQTCGQQIPDGFAERMLRSTDKMPDYLPSMYHDFVLKRPMELQAIYAEPLAAALKAGVALPHMQMLLQQLSFLDQRNCPEAAR